MYNDHCTCYRECVICYVGVKALNGYNSHSKGHPEYMVLAEREFFITFFLLISIQT